MLIEPVAKSYREIAKANFLRIPSFQRPYSWTPENTEEFWSDVISADGSDYFLGSVVFYKDGKDKAAFFITDGQQRITTITIALAVIRDLCDQLGLEDLAEGTHGFIEKVDEDNKNRYVLEYDKSPHFIATNIFDPEVLEVSIKSEEDATIWAAYEYFENKIRAHLATVVGDDWKSSAKTEKLVRAIRNTIINMQFVVLTLDDESDAFVIFETLNTRGKDLEVSDLIKNHFSKSITDKNKGIQTVTTRWNQLRSLFDGLSARIELDTFFVHYWLARERYVSKKNLFKEFKAQTPKAKAKERLDDILAASESYVAIVAPKESGWSLKEENGVRSSIDAINTFSVVQARPLLLSMVRKYKEGGVISLKSLVAGIEAVENFSFQFNAITQSRGGGGIAGMYASLAQAVDACESPQAFAVTLKAVQKKFKERDVKKEEFEVAFSKQTYHKSYTRDRALIRYILSKFRRHYHALKADDFEKFTIEHLVPQAGIIDSAKLDVVGNIGNLILVPEAVNQKLGTKSIKEKLKILAEHQCLDETLEEYDNFTVADIPDRAAMMATVAFDEIWKM